MKPGDGRNAGPLIGALIGMVAFFLVVGPRALDPGNIAWISRGDAAQHYLGWLFYRQSNWTFPLGLNPAYGLELSSAIVFSDSIPLLAIPFKVFSGFLPEVFQYFGIWLLVCFLLQGYFSFRLLQLVSNSTVIVLLGVVLFVFSPPMLFRIITGHHSLVAHFILTAALYFVLRPANSYRILSWCVLLFIAALTHAYLLAMAGALWVIDTIERERLQKRPPLNVMMELACITGLVGFVVWQAGYFAVGGGLGGAGFGHYRMHPLAPIDASGWSYVLDDIPQPAATLEGFNFLGLGVLFLAVFAVIPSLASRTDCRLGLERRPFLGLGLLAFVLFSLSHRIGIQTLWFEVPLPDFMTHIAGIFKSSGRFFWPVFYMIYLAVFCLIVRGYSKGIAITALGLGVLVQVLDTGAYWTAVRDSAMQERSYSWDVGMESGFWEEVAARYEKTRALPVVNKGRNWRAISYYSGVHGFPTSAVYLARLDPAGLASAREETEQMIDSGRYQSDTLNFVKEDLVPVIASNLDKNEDLLARIDDYYILTPG